MLRTYLIVGGDQYERGVVAGNVALAAHTAYKVLRPFGGQTGGHLCTAVDALKCVLGEEPAAEVVFLVEGADPLFDAGEGQQSCPRCAVLEPRSLHQFLRERGGTYLFAVGASPAPASSGPGSWRPDVVVYLTHAEPSSLVKALAGQPRVRRGSARVA
jgi:hypothetical protein